VAKLAELQAECAAVGLPTYGSIPQLEARLAQYRAGQPDADSDDPLARLGEDDADGDSGGAADDAAGAGTPGPDPAVSPDEPGPVAAGPAQEPDQVPTGPAEEPAPLLEFTAKYATHGPPDDVTHQQLCRQVRDDALAAGHTPRNHGLGHRIGTVWDGDSRFEEYAISLRRA